VAASVADAQQKRTEPAGFPGSCKPQETSGPLGDELKELHTLVLLHLEACGVGSPLLQRLSCELEALAVARPAVAAVAADSELARAVRYLRDGRLRVVLQTLTGPLCNLEVAGSTTVGELKVLIQKCTEIPAREQRLIRGDVVLSRLEQPLAACGVTPWEPKITLVRVQQSRVLSASEDGRLRIWDPPTGECLRVLEGHAAQVFTAIADGEAGLALSCSMDETLKLWSLESGECLRTLSGHDGAVGPVVADWAEMQALSGSADMSLKLWSLETGSCLRTLSGHAGHVSCVDACWQTRRAVSGSRDNTLRLWDLDTAACKETLQGHEGNVMAVAADWPGMRLLSGSLDGTLRLWDIAAAACLRTLKGHFEGVLSVVADWSTGQAMSGSMDRTLRLWDLAGPEGGCLRVFEGHGDAIFSVAADWQAGTAVSSSADTSLRFWDLETGACTQTVWHRPGGFITNVDYL